MDMRASRSRLDSSPPSLGVLAGGGALQLDHLLGVDGEKLLLLRLAHHRAGAKHEGALASSAPTGSFSFRPFASSMTSGTIFFRPLVGAPYTALSVTTSAASLPARTAPSMEPRNFWLVQSPASVKLEMGVAWEGRYLLRPGIAAYTERGS